MSDVDLGSDVDSYKLNAEGELDLDPMFGIVEGPAAVAQAVMRRYETPHGSCDDDPDCGDDVIELLNSDLAEDAPYAIAQGLEAEARKDERVDTVTASATFDQASDKLTLSVKGTTAEGPFKLIIQSSGLSLDAIRITPSS